ncbi:MAG: chromosomal replication initiator protein DnaA [Actinobacteria bacterium]|nr:chromosomal replication initiator protein DnaA [Actinomycetota bacterium]
MEAQSAAENWEAFRRTLRDQVTPITWQTWLEALQPDVIEDDVVRLVAPSEFHLRWVNDKYRPVVEHAVSEVFGPRASLQMDARPEPIFDIDDDGEDDVDIITAEQPAATPVPVPGEQLVTKYTFENFVVGPSNRFAHAAAMAIAEQPGGYYNPLFVYGAAGLGKTHLLQAIALHARDLRPGLTAKYVTSEQFFNDFIDGIRSKRMAEFKGHYRTVDMLLLDDVQFLEGKEQILEEFFHTFNALYEAGKQLVFSSDRPPRSLTTLEDRIRSRFEWGLTTDIQPPDIETRLAILRRNATFAPQPVPEPVLEFIAERVVDNIRELEGALTRVTAYAALTHQPIDLDMATDVLQDLDEQKIAAPISTGRILSLTAEAYGVTVTDMEGPSRRQPLARGRQIAMYLCRELTDLSLPKIGALFGGRDHTTALHGINKIRDLMTTDEETFEQVTALLQSLRTSTR